MILKSYETKKINLDVNKFLLLYGKNEGLKNHIIKDILSTKKNIFNYEEKEIFDNSEIFLENLLTKSLFESEKVIIIKRVTNNLIKILDKISNIISDDLIIVLNADNLEKRSKLRSMFEKHKEYVCIPVYPDNEQTLLNLAVNYLKDKKILMSHENANLLVNKCRGNREALLNELQKIEFLSKSQLKLTSEKISKLVNLNEDYSVSELIDNCLAKNQKKTINILNENNFSAEDCILIIRVFLNKSKKILELSSIFEKNQNIDLTISAAKPPIFWKDKEITKKQIYLWKPKHVKNLIYKLHELELITKKNINNSINLVRNFILEQCSSNTNN